MITFSNRLLRQALGGLRQLKVSKQSTETLRCVRLQGAGDTVRFEATNLDESLSFEGRSESSSSGSQLVPYELLQDVQKSADLDSAITVTPGSDIRYQAGGTGLTIPLPGHKLEDWPPVHVLAGSPVELPAGVLGSMVEAQGCASTDSGRYLLNSVYLTPHEIVSTDGRQLYRRNGLELPIPEPGLIFPLSGVPGILNPDHPAELWAWDLESTPKAGIAQGPWRWITKLVVGNYPDFRRVLPKVEQYETVVKIGEPDAARLITVLPRLPGFKEPSHPVVLTVTGAEASLAPPSRLPQVKVVLDRSALTAKSETTIQFNAGFLLGALKRGFRELRLRDALSPVLMNEASRQYLWMPINLEPSPSAPAPEPAAEPQPEPEPKEEAMVASVNRIESPEPAKPSGDLPAESAVPTVDAAQQVQRARELLRELNGTLGQLLVGLRETARQHRAMERDYEALKRNLRVLKSVEV